ncbi:MAG: sugar ABC transporter substrate-binding protein [Butyrivibrio sp.]|nr:sugar ABC transporter substrate-binding protein [Butyrivibrio sp.]
MGTDNKVVRKRYLIIGATIVFIILTLVVGSLAFMFYRADLNNQAEIHEYQKYYVMITDNYKADFWQSVYEGALEVAKENDIYVDLLGQDLPGEHSCEELMKIAIASHVDGIILYANESDSMTKLINEAMDDGIPVVTLYGDNTHSDRISYVGVGGYSIGKMYGKQVINLIKEKRREDFIESETMGERQQIKITVLATADAQDTGQNIIITAMQDTIDQNNATDSEFSVSIYTVDNTNAFSVEESIRDIFLNDEIPDVIVCLNELNTICAYQAVVDFNKVGDVNILGYYDSFDIVNAIDRGGVYATVSIDTWQLGEYSIEALEDYYEFGNTSEYYLADVTLINKSNVSSYLYGEEMSDE